MDHEASRDLSYAPLPLAVLPAVPGCYFTAAASEEARISEVDGATLAVFSLHLTAITASSIERGLSRQRLVEVADQVLGAFEADREADHVRAGAGGLALFVAQLAVHRRGRVQNQAAGIADIREVREQLDVFLRA